MALVIDFWNTFIGTLHMIARHLGTLDIEAIQSTAVDCFSRIRQPYIHHSSK